MWHFYGLVNLSIKSFWKTQYKISGKFVFSNFLNIYLTINLNLSYNLWRADNFLA